MRNRNEPPAFDHRTGLLRRRRPPGQLHARGGRDEPHAGRGEPPGHRPRTAPGGGAVRAPARGARAHRGRPRLPRRGAPGAAAHRARHRGGGGAPGARRAAAAVGGVVAGQLLADPAPAGLHARAWPDHAGHRHPRGPGRVCRRTDRRLARVRRHRACRPRERVRARTRTAALRGAGLGAAPRAPARRAHRCRGADPPPHAARGLGRLVRGRARGAAAGACRAPGRGTT